MNIRVVTYDSSWPLSFVTEAGRIQALMSGVIVQIHHIGSTSIPGIMAKPIIDMLAEVNSLDKLDKCTPDLIALGYEAKGEFGIPGRRYFRRDDEQGIRTHQIHAFRAGSPEIPRHLAFRDYLIAHPDIALKYGEWKKELAARFPDDIYGYMDGKDAFIKEHQTRALRWREI